MSNYREDKPGASAQEQFTSNHRTHEELVAAFRGYLKSQEEIDRKRGLSPRSPEEEIGLALFRQWYEEPDNSPKREFFEPLYNAWDILTYDRLPKDSQYGANNRIAHLYWKTHTLRLNDGQVSALDAMAEAVGIQRPRGQREIPVPERYAYWRYGHNGPGAIDPVTGGPGKE